MPIIVQKFGGTSVADSEKILAAARKAIRASQQGNQVVMVVSAMGKNTDTLLSLASEINDSPPARELDMLLSTGEQVSVALMAMAIHSLGAKAVSLTGAQIGIRTDAVHTKARIRSISTERMEGLLNEGNIVIAAGFQGIDEDFNITTLGRGGSDTTAVALAAVLRASACEIYTDVDGVYTTDPRLLPEARRVPRCSYDEMLELASLGAGVLHSRSVEFAKKFGVPIHVRSSFSDIPGTMVVSEPESRSEPVSGAAVTKYTSLVTVQDIPDTPGTSLQLFSKIAEQNIPVDMIVQNVGAAGKADISFTVQQEDLYVTREAVEETLESFGGGTLRLDDAVSKVSVVGLGMARQTGVADRMFRALAEAEINILMITTSEIKISVLVQREQAFEALRIVHKVFGLDTPPADAGMEIEIAPPAEPDLVAIVDRLAGMEDVLVDDVSSDDSQSRITIRDIPDTPGIAAAIFEQIASGGVFVDMIVQSFGHKGQASLSFTVPKSQLEKAEQLSRDLAISFGCGHVGASPAMAKLMVSGIGMRSNVGVAIRMFQALSQADINVEMVNTSEVRVNVVIDAKDSAKAVQVLQQAFSDTLS